MFDTFGIKFFEPLTEMLLQSVFATLQLKGMEA